MKNIILLLSFSLSLFLFSCSSDDGNKITLPEELNFTGDIIGCGDFSVRQLLDSENLNVSLSISGTGREDLNLTSEYKSFALPNNNLVCVIALWDAPAGGNFCNDVVHEGPNLISKWDAVSGNLKLLVSDIEETEFETYYKITILLENVVFEKSNGNEQRTIPNLIIEEVFVGWLPG